MAAGQQKKRLINSSLHKHYRGKREKKLDPFVYVLNLRSQIYLEWDESQKKAVAKREQIGITWADMAPFFDSVPRCTSDLADVFCIPEKIYSLNNLMEVLSYEVWATCLSESERKLLTQFLPSGTGAEQAVQSLFSGENHHFGNPFLRWSTLLCSGFFHPDDVVQRERQIRSNKKQYYSDLNKYHSNMLEGLKNWKDRWLRCSDTEKLRSKTLIKPNERTLPITSERVKEVPQKVYIRNGDIAKYMSYIKISKKQHEAIKNFKNSADGIQSKFLRHVLGDINSFHVHQYEALEGEEKIRLREHWSQVVTRDLPAVFEARKEQKFQIERLKKCLQQELSKKRTLLFDKIEIGKPEISPPVKIEGGESDAADVLVQEYAISPSSNSSHSHHLDRIPSLNSHQEPSPMELDKKAVGQDTLILGDNCPVISLFNGKENLGEDLLVAKAVTSPVKEMWHTVDGHDYNSFSDLSPRKSVPIEECQAPFIGKKAVGQDILILGDNSPVISQFIGKENLGEGLLEAKAVISPVKQWKTVDSPSYNSSSDLSLRKSEPIEECQAPLIYKKAVGRDNLILGDSSPVIPQLNVEENLVEGLLEPKVVASTVKEMWQSVDNPSYNSSSDLSLGESEPIEECQAPLIYKKAVCRDILILGDSSPVIPQLSGKENLVEGLLEPKVLASTVKEMWQSVDNPSSNSSSDLSLRKSEPIEVHRAPIIDLERDVEQEAEKSDDASLYSLFTSQSRNNLLQSFAKDPEILSSYPREQMNHLKQPELQFLMANGGLSETLQFPHQFQEQQNLMEQSHTREKDHLYMHPMMNKSIYSNGSYPSQELYPSANGDLVECNWFPNNHHQSRNNYWSGVETSSNGTQCLGDGGGNSDGSLFNVLSTCTNMPSRTQYSTMNSEQWTEARNFGPNNDSVYGYVPHQFKSSNNHESAAASTVTLHVPWMNYQPHQNSSMQDSVGKPYVRSWNQ